MTDMQPAIAEILGNDIMRDVRLSIADMLCERIDATITGDTSRAAEIDAAFSQLDADLEGKWDD